MALEEVTQMVRDLQIAHARRDGGEATKDRKLPAGSRCLWCDAVGHARKDCRDFTEVLRTKVMYLSNGRVHDCETRKMHELNVGKGGMKRLMEEAAARHAETVHYSASSAGIRVGGEEGRKAKDSGFWPSLLEGLAGVRLKKEESDRAEKRIQEVAGWDDPVEEKTGFVEAACQNYEVQVEEKRVGKAEGLVPRSATKPASERGRRTLVVLADRRRQRSPASG
jgi:hypothetical protein